MLLRLLVPPFVVLGLCAACSTSDAGTGGPSLPDSGVEASVADSGPSDSGAKSDADVKAPPACYSEKTTGPSFELPDSQRLQPSAPLSPGSCSDADIAAITAANADIPISRADDFINLPNVSATCKQCATRTTSTSWSVFPPEVVGHYIFNHYGAARIIGYFKSDACAAAAFAQDTCSLQPCLKCAADPACEDFALRHGTCAKFKGPFDQACKCSLEGTCADIDQTKTFPEDPGDVTAIFCK